LSFLNNCFVERKITVLDTGIFPILKVENFLTETQYNDIKNEIRKICWLTKKNTDIHGRDYKRIYLDDLYGASRKDSKILTVMSETLFDDKMLEVYNTIQETAFKIIKYTTKHESQLTFYYNDCEYKWHVDDISMRLVNYVLMIDMGMKFDGGHTLISNEQHEEKNFLSGVDMPIALDIKPKGNQLLIMPCWITHSVSQIKMKSNNLLDGRITVNGHIGFRDFKKEVT